jgi:predicted Fe-Mo cluster-binding NifX family protein
VWNEVSADRFPRRSPVLRDALRQIASPDTEDLQEKVVRFTRSREDVHMRIAIPLADGRLSMHFGHCERFALIDVDPIGKKILKREDIDAPPHQPGLLPAWLAERGTNMIIAGGVGQRAMALFSEQGIQVIVGAQCDTPARLVAAIIAGELKVGENVCDH